MYAKKIKLDSVESAKNFVNQVGKFNFDVDIQYNRFAIDAKSLLGVLSLDLTRDLVVKYGEKDLSFENMLDKYAVS